VVKIDGEKMRGDELDKRKEAALLLVDGRKDNTG
jgi:hypothetical protein